MAPFIHGRQNSIHIIDLRQTMRGILRARNLLFRIAAEGQSVLWVGTKRQVKGVIADAGERTGMPIVTERWIGGTLTNFSVIRSRLRRLEELEAIDEVAIEAQKLTKKEVATLTRERRKITRNLGGIRDMATMPGAMVVVDPSREVNAAREARKMGVVTIGLLDTDCDPDSVDIVVPGNDDALKSVRLLIDFLVESVEAGWHQHRESAATMGDAEKREEEAATDEVRPTRSQRAPKRRPKPAPEASGESGEKPAPAEGAPTPAAASDEIPPATPPPAAETPAEPAPAQETPPAPAPPNGEAPPAEGTSPAQEAKVSGEGEK